MRFNKVHCLFEQSGTFKNEFKKIGFDAFDYDILNEFNETDYVCDLFAAIEKGFEGGESIFDNIDKNDLVMAFFPCTRFEVQVIMYYKGVANGMENWDLKKKLEYDLKLHKELHRNYSLITKLVLISLNKGFKLIIENPYSSQSYLTRYWALTPKIIDYNRRDFGDYFEKPTQFFFVNCEPENNLIMDEGLEYIQKKTIAKSSHNDKDRSKIHPQYARRFIRSYIYERDMETDQRI